MHMLENAAISGSTCFTELQVYDQLYIFTYQ